ncbi:MAG: hypothetical protein AAFY78_01225 [Cyanobacteria bacterium J06648_16]
MSDSEIASLCQQIYRQHRQALDLIYEHRPDLQTEIFDYLTKLISSREQEFGLQEDGSRKQFIRFAPLELDSLAFQSTCEYWTTSKRLLLCEFVNESTYLGLHIVLGPGDKVYKQRISKALRDGNIAGFRNRCQLKESGWSRVCKRRILGASDYVDEDWDSLREKITDFFDLYLRHDLKKICDAILSEFRPNHA